MQQKTFKDHKVFNICSNKPTKLTTIIKKINLISKRSSKVYKTKLQKADIIKTHGNNNKIKQFTKFKKFTKLDLGLNNLINWFKSYK